MSRNGARLAAMVATAGLLSACASQPHGTSTRQAGHSGQSSSSKVMRTASGAKIGAPYQINGVWYYPREEPHYDKIGIASWYGPGFDGRPTATGEIYDMNALTAAHTTLPLPTNVEVTNLENGRSLVLRVNDRGPFVGQRVIDVSRRAAQLLGFAQQGTAKVRVRALPDAGSNTMLASASTPSVETQANMAPMAGGNTQLLASSGRASSTRVASADARMAPVPNPTSGSRVDMAPIPNPVAPSTAVASAQLPPLPTARSRARPEFDAAYAAGPVEQQRTLASIMPPPSRQTTASPRMAAADTAPRPGAASWAGNGRAPEPSQRQPRLNFVVGPQPAVILSDASSGGAASEDTYIESAPVSSPTIAPTLASATMSESGSAGPSFGGGVYIQAGAFVDGGNAEHLRAEVARLGQTDIETASIDGRLFHRVVIGPLASVNEADLTLAKLRQMGHPGARILSR